MRRTLPFAMLLLLGCTGGQAGGGQATGGCAAHQAAFPPLIGGTLPAAREALAAMPGIRNVRVGGPNTPMTRDYRQDRATVIVENDKVSSITCG